MERQEWFNWCSGRSGYYYFDDNGCAISEEEYNKEMKIDLSTREKALNFLRSLTKEELMEIEMTLDEAELLIYQVREEREAHK